jgi:hypothetical protein
MEKQEVIPIPEYQLESKNLTLGMYDYSEVQQNVITLIQQQLEKYMTKDAKEAVVRLDSMGEPYIVIDTDEASSKKNKAYVIEEVRKMFDKTITFRWRHPTWGEDIKTTCPIVTAIHDVVGKHYIKVNYNRWAIPFLIWYGKGVGGTVYDKTISLTLQGKYTKRIYKLICSYRDKDHYDYDIKQFCKDFNIAKSYTPNKIKNLILKKAKEDIDMANSDVTFDYEILTVKLGKAKPKADKIRFYPHWKKTRNNLNKEDTKLYSKCYRIISVCNVPETDVVTICDLLLNNGMMKIVCERWDYYEDRICAGDRMASGQPYTTAIAINSMRKMMREELEKLGVDPRKMSCLYPKGEE